MWKAKRGRLVPDIETSSSEKLAPSDSPLRIHVYEDPLTTRRQPLGRLGLIGEP